jgi:hypothetical protein
MSVVLYAVGAFAALAGVVLIGFGIPVNEFSFGNTLIVSGVTSLMGGLIVASLGVVVAQLQRFAEAQVSRTTVRPPRPLDNMFGTSRDMAGAPRDMTGVQFPAKPTSAPAASFPFETRLGASVPGDSPADESPVHSFAPVLRNPEESDVADEDDVSLSPRQPTAAGGYDMPSGHEHDVPSRHEPEMPFDRESAVTERRSEPALEAGWRPTTRPPQPRQPHTTYFDAMWPAETKPAKDAEQPDERYAFPAADATPQPEPAAAIPEENEPVSVAILKSGVVDGMGYTLYVDGSIEAELPQGTLRFASINELRSHLEKNS